MDELEKDRIERVKTLLFALKTVALKIRREKKKMDPYYYLTATEDKNILKVNMFKVLDSPLYYLHMGLGSKFENMSATFVSCSSQSRINSFLIFSI